MLNITKMLVDGAILSLIASSIIVISLWLNPLIWLQDYPKDIQSKVPVKTRKEEWWSFFIGIPFLILLVAIPYMSSQTLINQSESIVSFFVIFVHAFGILFIFNLIDWLILDWWMFCTLTPKFLVIPGTEGMAGYKDYTFHFRAFVNGTILSAITGGDNRSHIDLSLAGQFGRMVSLGEIGIIERWKSQVRGLRKETYALYLAVKNPRTPWYAKAFIALVVGYAISPIDLIPDFIPVLGYLDDLILIPLGIALALKMIPKTVIEECREEAQKTLSQDMPRNWVVGGVIIAIWLALAALVTIAVLRTTSE